MPSRDDKSPLTSPGRIQALDIDDDIYTACEMRWIADERQTLTKLLCLILAVVRQHQGAWAQLVQTGVGYLEVDPLAGTRSPSASR
jgi:hypothetical protein